MYRDQTRDHIDNRTRDEERRNLSWSLFDHVAHIFFDHRQSADSRTNVDTNALRIFFRDHEPRIVDCHLGRGHTIVNEGVHATHFFGRHPLGRIEILDLAGKASRQYACVKSCDRPDTAATIDRVVPRLGNAIADRREDAETRDDYASFGHGLR